MQIEQIEEWKGQPVVDTDGERVGKLEDILFAGDDARLGCVGTGLFGRKLSLVPLHEATLGREHVRVPYSKAAIKDAPTFEDGGAVSGELEGAVLSHYGVSAPAPPDDAAWETGAQRESRAEEQRAARQRADELAEQAQAATSEAQQARARADEAEETARAAEERRREAEEAASQARAGLQPSR